MCLYEKMLNLRLGDGDDVRSYVHDIEGTHTQFRTVGWDIGDMLYKLALLRSLYTRFENLPVALETNIDTIFFEERHTRIVHEKERQKSVSDGNVKALRLHDGGPKWHTVSFYCEKNSHKIADCWKRKNSEKKKKEYGKGGPVDDPQALTLLEMKFWQSKWVVDSGTNYHICRDRGQFLSLGKKTKLIYVAVEDDSMLHAAYKRHINFVF